MGIWKFQLLPAGPETLSILQVRMGRIQQAKIWGWGYRFESLRFINIDLGYQGDVALSHQGRDICEGQDRAEGTEFMNPRGSFSPIPQQPQPHGFQMSQLQFTPRPRGETKHLLELPSSAGNAFKHLKPRFSSPLNETGTSRDS